MTLLQQFECDDLQSEFNSICYLSRVRSRDFGDRICLSDDEEVFDFSQEIFGLSLDGIPGLRYQQEINGGCKLSLYRT